MNKRDTIIVAALLNAAVLAVLFMMAVNSSDDNILPPSHETTEVFTKPVEATLEKASWAMEDAKMYASDEVDELLREFDALASEMSVSEKLVPEEIMATNANQEREKVGAPKKAPESELDQPEKNIVEITVKKGDILERIARANRTTIAEIKKLNNLKSERLAIGQVLKVPVPQFESTGDHQSEKALNRNQSSNDTLNQTSKNSNEVVYYTIKSGDNPWKIAKQLRIRMEDLLSLNELDEEKARNLKVGDRIRVK